MIAFLARMLVNTAARRWPESAGMRREWLAELDCLAGQGRQGQMLRFAGGLTFARPTHLPVLGFNWRTAGTFLLLIAGPVAIIAAQYFMIIIAGPPTAPSSTGWTLPVWFAVSCAIAVPAGWWSGTVSVLKGPFVLAVLLTVSVCGLLIAVIGGPGHIGELLLALDVWAPALVVLLMFVSRASQRGRGLPAVAIALPLWLIVLDVATIVTVTRWSIWFPEYMGPGLVDAHAPLWFLYQFIGTTFGVLTSEETGSLNVMTTHITQMLVVFAVYAMTYAARAARVSAGATSNLGHGQAR